jgi:hypothetical protein
MPPNFTPRNGVGCYSASVAPGSMSSLDFCVGISPVDERGTRATIAEGPEPACQFDCWLYEEVETQDMSLGSHAAFVQTALVSGGIGGQTRVPTVFASFELGSAWAVFFRGEGVSSEDIAQLLRIASTVTLR